jgi:type I restriction enzyme, S subunit
MTTSSDRGRATEKSLIDFVALKRGYDLPSQDREPGEVPILGSFGITGWHNYAKHRGPGVSIGRSGASIGVATYTDLPYWPLNTTLYVTDFKGNDPRFVYYVLDSIDFRSFNSGGAIPSLNRNYLGTIKVPDLPVVGQRRIAAILSAYDDLIENNNRRIRLLEKMAQLIHHEWFVDFRYPEHETVSLVDSTLGSIPEGWSVKAVGEIASRERYAVTGGPFGSKLGTKDYRDRGVPVIRGTNLAVGGGFRDSDFVFVSDAKADTMMSCLAHRGDILVTQRGTLGQVGLIPPSARFDRYLLSQSQMKITVDPEIGSPQYLYAALRSPEVTARLLGHAMTAGVPHINLSLLRNFQVVWPERALQEKFDRAVHPLGELVENLTRSSENARVTRSLLLPRLVSGAVDVTDLSIEVPEAAA